MSWIIGAVWLMVVDSVILDESIHLEQHPRDFGRIASLIAGWMR